MIKAAASRAKPFSEFRECVCCTAFESAFIIIVTRSVSHFGSRIQLKQDGARSKQDGARY